MTTRKTSTSHLVSDVTESNMSAEAEDALINAIILAAHVEHGPYFVHLKFKGFEEVHVFEVTLDEGFRFYDYMLNPERLPDEHEIFIMEAIPMLIVAIKLSEIQLFELSENFWTSSADEIVYEGQYSEDRDAQHSLPNNDPAEEHYLWSNDFEIYLKQMQGQCSEYSTTDVMELYNFYQQLAQKQVAMRWHTLEVKYASRLCIQSQEIVMVILPLSKLNLVPEWNEERARQEKLKAETAKKLETQEKEDALASV